jgi:hypothetical protein
MVPTGFIDAESFINGAEAHEKTPGRSQAFSSPSGGLAHSDRSGGALSSCVHLAGAQT